MWKNADKEQLEAALSFLRQNRDFVREVAFNTQFYEELLWSKETAQVALQHPYATHLLVTDWKLEMVLLRFPELEEIYVAYLLGRPIFLKDVIPVSSYHNKTHLEIAFEGEWEGKTHRIAVTSYQGKWKKVWRQLWRERIETRKPEPHRWEGWLTLEYVHRKAKVNIAKTDNGYVLTVDNLHIILSPQTVGNLFYLLREVFG